MSAKSLFSLSTDPISSKTTPTTVHRKAKLAQENLLEVLVVAAYLAAALTDPSAVVAPTTASAAPAGAKPAAAPLATAADSNSMDGVAFAHPTNAASSSSPQRAALKSDQSTTATAGGGDPSARAFLEGLVRHFAFLKVSEGTVGSVRRSKSELFVSVAIC